MPAMRKVEIAGLHNHDARALATNSRPAYSAMELEPTQRPGYLELRLRVDGFFAKEIIHTHTALSEGNPPACPENSATPSKGSE